MNATQKRIMNTIFAGRIGCFFHDRRQMWVWPQDIRENAELAEEVLSDRSADIELIEKRIDDLRMSPSRCN